MLAGAVTGIVPVEVHEVLGERGLGVAAPAPFPAIFVSPTVMALPSK